MPLVLLLLMMAAGWLALGGEAPRAADRSGTVGARAQTVATEPRTSDGEPAAEVEPRKARSRDQREAMRRRIVEALASRERAAEPGAGAPADDEPQAEVGAKKKATAAAADEAPRPGSLIDRSGDHGYLLKVMNEELMPLVDECYELARAGRPELAGMLVLDVEILGEEEIGGVVEEVAPGTNNELSDPTLNECVRESLYSTTLPAPPRGGRDAISLSLRLSPDAAE